MTIGTRREFLKSTLMTVAVMSSASMAAFGQMSALAGSGDSGYQALVCIFMIGGNDSHNMVVPLSTAQQNYSLYEKGRQVLAIPQKSLLQIANGRDTYGLHPSMPELQKLYIDGKAAVLANVGMLVQPLTRSVYQGNNGAKIPLALFSHSDQMGQWQSAIPNGIASSGWGGRIADSLQAQNAGSLFPPVTITSSCGLFCTGQQTPPANVPPPYAGSKLPTGMATLNAVARGAAIANPVQHLLTFDDGLKLVQASNAIVSRGDKYANTLTKLLANVKITTRFPAGNKLAAQLQTVAKVMSVRQQLGLKRQIFFCEIGGFDTHSLQL